MKPLYFLIVAPLFLIAPRVFFSASATPKMLAIAIGLYLILKPGPRPRAAATDQVAVFFLVCVLSWFTAVNHWIGLTGCPKAPYYGLFPVALVMLAYLGSTAIEESPLPLLAWSGAVLGIIAIVQVFAKSSLVGLEMQGGRASGMRGSPVMFGASLIPCFLAAWHYWRSTQKLGYVFVLSLIVGGMVAAGAKGALMATVAAVWAYETVGILRWGGLGVLMAALWGHFAFFPIRNDAERRELLKIAWVAFKQRPLFGWGPDNFIMAMTGLRTKAYIALAGPHTSQGSAHQDLAQVAATLGIFGLGSYLWMLWGIIRSSLEDPLSVALIVGMIFQAQVNPMPTDVLVIAAVVLGSRCLVGRRVHTDTDVPRWVGPIVLLAAIGLAYMDLTPQFRFWK